jgi:hypothetical protein
MISRKKAGHKLKITVDSRLNQLCVVKLSAEKLKEANETLSKIRLPDAYYEQIANSKTDNSK